LRKVERKLHNWENSAQKFEIFHPIASIALNIDFELHYGKGQKVLLNGLKCLNMRNAFERKTIVSFTSQDKSRNSRSFMGDRILFVWSADLVSPFFLLSILSRSFIILSSRCPKSQSERLYLERKFSSILLEFYSTICIIYSMPLKDREKKEIFSTFHKKTNYYCV